MMEPQKFFDLEKVEHRTLFIEDEPVWRTLDGLKDYIATFFDEPWPLRGISGNVDRPIVIVEGDVRFDLAVRPTGPKGKLQVFDGPTLVESAAVIMPGAYLFDDRVILGAGTVVEPGALIKGPFVVGENTEVRQGAYVRGDSLVGSDCVVGHATEIKASIMLDGAKAGHFAYIGDSILGLDVNMGAGTKLANLRMIPGNVTVRGAKKTINTGRRKLGAILGDRTETGCNSVTAPGALLGPESIVYPTISVPAGFYPGRTAVRMGRKGGLEIRSIKR